MDRLDWDAAIEEPPPRRSGSFQAKLRYKGRGKPMFTEDGLVVQWEDTTLAASKSGFNSLPVHHARIA